jgi:predicted RNase H-like HicB family nuclease
MIRTYSLIIEGDGAGHSGYVPELPTILVTGGSKEEPTARAREAIQPYWETLNIDQPPGSTLRDIEVELPGKPPCEVIWQFCGWALTSS